MKADSFILFDSKCYRVFKWMIFRIFLRLGIWSFLTSKLIGEQVSSLRSMFFNLIILIRPTLEMDSFFLTSLSFIYSEKLRDLFDLFIKEGEFILNTK